MSEFEKLKQVVEDNFVLQSMEMAEMRSTFSAQLGALGQITGALIKDVDAVAQTAKALAQSVDSLAKGIDSNLEKQSSRLETAVKAIRSLGDGSVDVRQELAELRARVEKLEDMGGLFASA